MSIILLLQAQHEFLLETDRAKGWLSRAHDRIQFIRQLQEEGNQ